MLTVMTVVAASLVAWAVVFLALRGAPSGTAKLAYLSAGSVAVYVLLALMFASVLDDAVRLLLITAMHGCLAVSALSWWWITLRVVAVDSEPLRLPLWLTHVVPTIVLAAVFASVALPIEGWFVSFAPDGELLVHTGWSVLIVLLALLSGTISATALLRGFTTTHEDARLRFFALSAVGFAPLLLGVIDAASGGPLYLFHLGFSLAAAAMVYALCSAQVHPGVITALQQLWAGDTSARLLLDRHDRIRVMNPAACQLLPSLSEKEEDVRQALAPLLTIASGEPLTTRGWFAGERLDTTESFLVRMAGGGERTYLFEARPVEATGATVLTFRDETTRERFREAALAARRMESLSHMAGNLAHRFNNLLVSVVGNVDIAKYQVELEPLDGQAVREVLHDIQVAGQQAAELAKQLVTFTTSPLGEMETLDLNQLVVEAMALIGKQHTRELRCDVALAESELSVRGDRAQLLELLLNLVTNAEDAYGEEGGSVRVTTGYRTLSQSDLVAIHNRSGMVPGEHAFLEVSDHGPGLPPAVTERLFDAFVTTKPDAKGLGLTTVLSAVVAHEGGIEVHSGSRGTRFTVYLPLLKLVVPDVEPLAIEGVPRDACLVVDDHAEVLNVHRAMLESLGRRAVATTSPAQALELARRYRFELALIDVSMPQLRGDELVTQMREIDPQLPVVLVSGYAEEQIDLNRLGERTAFLEKPFGLAELHEAMLHVCRVDTESARADVISLSVVQPSQD